MAGVNTQATLGSNPLLNLDRALEVTALIVYKAREGLMVPFSSLNGRGSLSARPGFSHSMDSCEGDLFACAGREIQALMTLVSSV